MQFKALLTFGLLGAAFAAPAVQDKRQVAVITGALTPIKEALTTLDTAVKALAAGANIAQQTTDLTAKSKAVEEALKKGTAAVEKAQAVSLTEAIQVQTASQELTKLTQQTIDDLIAKKSVIEGANQKKTVVDNLTAQKAASDAFIKAVVGKVPSAVSGVAQTLTKSIGDALQKGITAFS